MAINKFFRHTRLSSAHLALYNQWRRQDLKTGRAYSRARNNMPVYSVLL